MFIDPRTTRSEKQKVYRVVPYVQGFAVGYAIWEFDEVGGQIHEVDGVGYHLLKPYLCAGCRMELEAELATRVEDARQRKRAEEEWQRYEATWRSPKEEEFPIESASRRFLLISPSLSFRDIRLQWRTSKVFCRGSSPAFVMLMTVDDVFCGRCKFPNAPTRDRRIDAAENAAACLIAKWLQRDLQPELLSVRPDFEWDASQPQGCCCDTRDDREWRVFQTVWKDGSRYAALVDFRRISEIAELMERLGYRVIEQHLGSAVRV